MTTTQDKPVNNIGTATEFIPAVISENAEVVLEKRYLQKNVMVACKNWIGYLGDELAPVEGGISLGPEPDSGTEETDSE